MPAFAKMNNFCQPIFLKEQIEKMSHGKEKIWNRKKGCIINVMFLRKFMSWKKLKILTQYSIWVVHSCNKEQFYFLLEKNNSEYKMSTYSNVSPHQCLQKQCGKRICRWAHDANLIIWILKALGDNCTLFMLLIYLYMYKRK